MKVYPRVYGESSRGDGETGRSKGLSPRVRGIRPRLRRGRCASGSIPACTGNPRPSTARPDTSRVYPRVYGESAWRAGDERLRAGLSPRVRGIHIPGDPRDSDERSIPACTGNPCASFVPHIAVQVYPRVYGESTQVVVAYHDTSGLSPRVRGIPVAAASVDRQVGSIPACTGNPAPAAGSAARSRVYPRVYGESVSGATRLRLWEGLSPRVRGIRSPGVYRGSVRWSIPACTGNPPRQPTGPTWCGVYPRVYGESVKCSHAAPPFGGLSPRVRGIRCHRPAIAAIRGSIPACTGNPHRNRGANQVGKVYPRVYGESCLMPWPNGGGRGLSPRVRGIPLRR